MWLETTFSKREPVSLSWVVILAFLHDRQGFRTFSRSPVFKSAGSQVPKSLTARKFCHPWFVTPHSFNSRFGSFAANLLPYRAA